MLLVKGDKITFRYESQTRELLLEVSFRIDRGSRIGIIGQNGSGKSTLIKLLLGNLIPDSGHLQLSSQLRIGHLNQVQSEVNVLTVADFIWSVNPRLFELKKNIKKFENEISDPDWTTYTLFEESGGYDFELAIEKTLHEVGLEERFLERPFKSLSVGEKTKVGLLRVLITEPDLLLLDEPTNNLDVVAIQWLSTFLVSTKLPYVIVSHDRSLLDDNVNEIWDLDKGSLTVFTGNYSFFQKMKDKAYNSDLEMYEQQQKRIKQLESAAATRRVEANKMESFKKTRSVKNNGGLCKRDDGSGSVSANPAKKMRAAKAVEKRIQLMIGREDAKKPWLEKKRKISLPVRSTCKSQTVLSVNHLCLQFKTISIFSEVHFSVGRGQRLAIVGPNGSGKTSLLQLIHGNDTSGCGEIKWAPSAIVSVFSQEAADLSENKTTIQTVWQPGVVEEHFARIVLGSLGLDSNLINQKIGQLSPGEKVKIALARTILSGANVLIFDEPTNHLEIQAIEMLEQGLVGYKGTVIFVSHDLSFIRKIATQVFDLELNKAFGSFNEWEESLK